MPSSLLATLLIAQPALLDSFVYEPGGSATPVTEHISKPSRFLTSGQNPEIVRRNAHVLSLPVSISSQQTYRIFLPAGGPLEFGDGEGVSFSNMTYGGGPVLVAECSGSALIDIHLANSAHNPTAAPSPGNHTIYINYYDSGTGLPVTAPLILRFEKFAVVEDASIDTRRSYLEPNKCAMSEPDANDPMSYLNFGDWTYNGGLFAGQVLSPDRSGIGRSQFQFQEITSTSFPGLRASCLSLLRMPVLPPGRLPTYLGVYMIRRDDEPTEGFPDEMEQTWENRLPIAPNGEEWDGSPPVPPNTWASLMLNQYAIDQQTHVWDEEEDPEVDYLCFQIKSALRSEVATEHFLNRLVVAYPLSIEGPTIPAWRSFASKEYQAQGHAFPYNDAAPRIWIVRTTNE